MDKIIKAASAMAEALPDDTTTSVVLAACGFIAARILADTREERRRDAVEGFVDAIYATALKLERRSEMN